MESVANEGGCPSCGVMSSRVKDRLLCRLKDLPHGAVPLHVLVCKRRFVCTEKLCARGSFTEVSDQIPARSRLTTRLRSKVSAAVTTTNRAMSEVAGEYAVAWWKVHRILAATALKVLGQAAPTTMIGIDETRARSVRWFHQETGWQRSDPWMTSIVDLDPAYPGGIIGLAPGRSVARVEAWLALQATEFRDGVEVVAIDPSAPYASGICQALQQVRIVLDHGRIIERPAHESHRAQQQIRLTLGPWQRVEQRAYRSLSATAPTQPLIQGRHHVQLIDGHPQIHLSRIPRHSSPVSHTITIGRP